MTLQRYISNFYDIVEIYSFIAKNSVYILKFVGILFERRIADMKNCLSETKYLFIIGFIVLNIVERENISLPYK